MMDPYYRTTNGFMVLIEKEWVSFGHQFARRFGHGEDRLNFSDSQRSPVFIQWLECVWHALTKYPDLFEFDESLLEVSSPLLPLVCSRPFLISFILFHFPEVYSSSCHFMPVWNVFDKH